MENKVLVTGLWMGGEELFHEYCNACNYNYSWLFKTPTTFIWSDKIIITPIIDKLIRDESYPDENIVIPKAIKKTYEIAKQYNIIEINDPSNILTSKMFKKIDEEIEIDYKVLEKLYPNQVRTGGDEKVPGQIFIEGEEYCHPYIRSICVSLILAQKWGARCLFPEQVLNYSKYKFGSSLITEKNLGKPPDVFNTIFNSFLPEFNVFPDYVLQNLANSDRCNQCLNESKCNEEYLNKLENNLMEFFKLREYDEIIQLKQVMSDIISRFESQNRITDYGSIIREFRNEERKIIKRIRNTFPKIKRWSNLAIITSVPIAVVGIVSGLPMVSAIGASIAGLSKVASEYVTYLESKYKWVGFISKNISSPQK